MEKNALIKSLASMGDTEFKTFLQKYLPLLASSIKVQYNGKGMNHYSYRAQDLIDRFKNSEGWGSKRGSSAWGLRTTAWARTSYQYTEDSLFLVDGSTPRPNSLPIFHTMAAKALTQLPSRTSKNWQEVADAHSEATTTGRISATKQNESNTPKEKPVKNTLDKMINTNTEAATIAAKLSAGKVSNNFVLGKLLSAMPWYTKLFSKKKDLTTNPVAKLVTAQTAAAAIAHFAPSNQKLSYLAEAMVQDAMLDVTYNSTVLENLVSELENLVKIPDNIGKE